MRKFKLGNEPLAIIGYGSQGKAQALNLRDSGITPLIGLPPKSKARRRARLDGFTAVSTIDAIDKAKIVSILIPDHKHNELFDNIPRSILDGKALIFAHGLSIAFGLVAPPGTCDIVLVAPHGPGIRIRELFLTRKRFTAFWAIEHDASGNAAEIALAYAAAIGCPIGSLFRTTFRDEAVGDIFGEQAVLCGGLAGLIETGFSTLVEHGLPARDAYLECVYQLDLIIDLIKRHGPAGMFERISKTAAFGSLKNKNAIIDSSIRKKMERLYSLIDSGKFAGELLEESKSDMANLNKWLRDYKKSLLQKTHSRLSKYLEKK
jgi:ketol-acid reductoisomerase